MPSVKRTESFNVDIRDTSFISDSGRALDLLSVMNSIIKLFVDQNLPTR